LRRLGGKQVRCSVRREFESIGLASTANAKGCSRVNFETPDGNRFPAFGTPSIFPFRQAIEGDFNSRQIIVSASRLGLGHFLLLHRVHPRQATDALLIQLDRASPAGTFLIAGLQFELPIKQQFFQADDLRIGKRLIQD
jgi:hypothetical protein